MNRSDVPAGLLRRAWTIRGNTPAACLVAVLLFMVAHAARLALLDQLPSGFPYLTFFPAVILTAFFCGAWPGALCALLGGLGAWYQFITPGEPFSTHGSDLLALGFYAVIVSVDILLIQAMWRMSQRLLDGQRTVRRLHQEQETMFQELQHRVANNMQFVAGLLHFGKAQVAEVPEAAAVLGDAQRRLLIYSGIHRRLYAPEQAERPVHIHLTALCEELIAAGARMPLTYQVNASPACLDLPRLVVVSMLVSEIITNSIKHAFAGRERGEIQVSFEHNAGGYELVVADDGQGLPAGFAKGRSLGMTIINSLASQLGGKPEFTSGDGATVRIGFL